MSRGSNTKSNISILSYHYSGMISFDINPFFRIGCDRVELKDVRRGAAAWNSISSNN